MHSSSQTPARAAAVIVTIVVAAACAPPALPAPPSGVSAWYATRDGADGYVIERSGPDGFSLTTAPGNSSHNSRVLGWELDAPVSRDHVSCVTAEHTSWPSQEGVVVRGRTDGSRYRAVTVMKNIFWRATSIYNVHVWDSARAGSPFTPAHDTSGRGLSFDMSSAVTGDSTTGTPRRLCAKVVGDTLTIKVWPADVPEPSWSSPTHTRTADLAPMGQRARFDGRPGWYVGHIPPGGRVDLTDIASPPATPPPESPPDTTVPPATAPPPSDEPT